MSQALFRGAKAISSTLDKFVEAAVQDGVDTQLPIVTGELSDTWIWCLLPPVGHKVCLVPVSLSLWLCVCFSVSVPVSVSLCLSLCLCLCKGGWSGRGIGSDPIKLMKTRAIMRARAACEESSDSECSTANPSYYNFSRQVLKNLEHTWVIDADNPMHHWMNAVCREYRYSTMAKRRMSTGRMRLSMQR